MPFERQPSGGLGRAGGLADPGDGRQPKIVRPDRGHRIGQLRILGQHALDAPDGLPQHRQPLLDHRVAVEAVGHVRAVRGRHQPAVGREDGERYRHDPVVELVLNGRVALRPDLRQDLAQRAFVGLGVFGEPLEDDAPEVGVDHRVRLERQQHASHRGRVHRVARADAGREPDGPVQRCVGDVDDVQLVQHRHRRAAADLVGHLLEKGLKHDFRVDRVEVPGADRQHLGPQQEAPAVATQIAQLLQRVQRASCGGRRQAGQGRDLAQGHLRVLPREGLQDQQPSLERRDEFGVACFRHAKVAEIIRDCPVVRGRVAVGCLRRFARLGAADAL